MFSFENDAMLVQDREDLIALLNMRFGHVPSGIINNIYELTELDSIQRLILVAANAKTWELFLEELREGEDAFRITGEQFNPINMNEKG